MRYVISCTSKTPGRGRPGKGHKHIVAVGGTRPLPFRFTSEQVLAMIADGHFFVAHGISSHRDATVRGWPHPGKGPGLRSFTDGVKDDNLGELPPCPAR
jgi:hypothetical protein